MAALTAKQRVAAEAAAEADEFLGFSAAPAPCRRTPPPPGEQQQRERQGESLPLDEVWARVQAMAGDGEDGKEDFAALQGELGELIVNRRLGNQRYFPPGSTAPLELQPEPEPEPQPRRSSRPSPPRASHFLSLRVRSAAMLDAAGDMQSAQCAAAPGLEAYVIEPVVLPRPLRKTMKNDEKR